MILKPTRPFLTLGLIVTALACATISLRAQAHNKQRDDQDAAKRKELERNSLRLLDEAIGDAGNLKYDGNRAYILAVAADLLWSRDEKRARTLFWEALATLKSPMEIEANETLKNPKALTSGITKEWLEHSDASQLRHALLEKVARCDPQLALDMLRSTRQSGPLRVPENTRHDLDVHLEEVLMYAAAAKDPDRVLQLARENLARGLDLTFLDSLEEVIQRNPDAGTKLSAELIAKFKTENLVANKSAAIIATQMLLYSRPKGLTWIGFTEPSRVVLLKLDDHQRQELADMLTNATLNAPAGALVLRDIQRVMREIRKYAPDRVAKVQARIAEYNGALKPDQCDRNNFSLRFEQATPEEMVKAAPTVSDELHRGLFYQAGTKAVVRGETDRFRELLNSEIKNETERRRALDDLADQQLDYDIENGKSDDLDKLIPLLRVKSQRVIAMSHLAMLLEKKDQHDKALRLLDDARKLANEEPTKWPVTMMTAYAVVEPAKAFAIIEPLIERYNDEMSKPAILDPMVTEGALTDGEVILNRSVYPLDSKAEYLAGIVALAQTDFDRTRALAERFQRNEVKIAAKLVMARALLGHLEQPADK